MMKMDNTRRAAVAHHSIPPMKNPSRERMKAEIALLRGELETLETSRRLLVRQKRAHKETSERTIIETVYPLGDVEQENKRLRRAVAQQLHTINRMVATFHVDAAWLVLNQQPSLSTILHDDNGYRFSVLLDGVDRMYRQAGRMIRVDNTVPPQKFEPTLASLKMNGSGLQTLEGRETTLIPYDLEHCRDVMWRAIKDSSWSGYQRAVVYPSTADTVLVRLFSSHTVQGKTVAMTTSLVTKRFVDADRTTVVYRAVSSLDVTEMDSDTYVDESGWSVLQRVTDHDLRESVVKKCCVQWAPQSFGQYEDCAISTDLETDALTNLALAKSMVDAAEISESMENLLIDECMSD